MDSELTQSNRGTYKKVFRLAFAVMLGACLLFGVIDHMHGRYDEAQRAFIIFLVGMAIANHKE